MAPASESRPTWVLMPGLDGTGILFAPLLEALDDRLPTAVLRYPPDEPLGYAELLERIRPMLPPGELVLVGESFSGPLAIELAADLGERVRGLVLSASFARNPAPELARSLAFMMPLAAIFASFGPTLRAFLMNGKEDSLVWRLIKEAEASVKPAVYQHRIRAILDVDVRASLRALELPVLYLRALRDRLVGEDALELVRDCARALRVAEVDAPHLLLQMAAEEASEHLLRFAAELD